MSAALTELVPMSSPRKYVMTFLQFPQRYLDFFLGGEAQFFPHEAPLRIEQNRGRDCVNVPEWTPTSDEIRVGHGDGKAETESVAERDDERSVVSPLEHDGSDLDLAHVLLQDAVQEPRLRLRSHVVRRDESDEGRPTVHRFGAEPAFAVDESILKMERRALDDAREDGLWRRGLGRAARERAQHGDYADAPHASDHLGLDLAFVFRARLVVEARLE
jgi:hypothetical protein